LGLLLTILVAAASGFTKAEVERIWLFLVPFASIAVAGQLRWSRWLMPTLMALALQTLATEIMFGTTW